MRRPRKAGSRARRLPPAARLFTDAIERDEAGVVALVKASDSASMYLGLDCGTSGLKALLTDERGAPIASAARLYAPDHPKPNWSEQDPEVWRAAMAGAVADLRGSAAEALDAVRAIGFSGQMHGAVMLDRREKPVRPAILHNDGRAYAEAAELARDFPHLAGVVGV